MIKTLQKDVPYVESIHTGGLFLHLIMYDDNLACEKTRMNLKQYNRLTLKDTLLQASVNHLPIPGVVDSSTLWLYAWIYYLRASVQEQLRLNIWWLDLTPEQVVVV